MSSNARISDLRSDLQRQISDTKSSLEASAQAKFDILSQKIEHLDQKIDDTRDILRADLHRVEEVMDARIKHLEEGEK